MSSTSTGSRLAQLLPANRVAAIAAFLTGLASAILAISHTFPKNWQQTSVAIVGIIGAIGTALHFMLGSQKMDQNVTQSIIADKHLAAAQIYQELNSGTPANIPIPEPSTVIIDTPEP